jgi:mycoredoxin
MQQPILLYGHPSCPGLPPVMGMLKQVKAPYTYINIHQDEAARLRVTEINNGYESVPTLVFPDGSTLTEPSFGQLRQKLMALGYRVGVMAWLVGNAWLIFIAAGVLVAILSRVLDVF